MVIRLKGQLAADAVELGQRRLVERGLRLREDRAGIGHRLVKEQGEEIVAQIVVRGDVPPASRGRIAPQQVGDPPQRAEQSGRPALHRRGNGRVLAENAHQSHQVVARPPSAKVCLRRAETAVKNQAVVEPWIMDLQRSRQARALRLAEGPAALAVFNHEPAALYHFQPPPHRAAKRRPGNG